LIETFNGNCLATLKQRLEKLTPTTHIVCAQEITMTREAMADMDAWGAPRGWTFLAAPSLTSQKGKAHLGTAIFVRAGVGIRWPNDQKKS